VTITAIDVQTIALTWQSYDVHTNQLVTRTVLVLPEGAADRAARFGEIPGVRNPRIDTAHTVELGDVPAPRFGWTEDERHEVPMFPDGYAAKAVRCPKCRQPGGMGCTSTGGGNAIAVTTHKARTDRVAGWTNAVQEHAAILARAVGHHGYARESLFAVFEQAAAPIPDKGSKQPTPKGVRLSEAQAEYIEWAVQRAEEPGVLYCPTGHLSGDHETRQSILALEAKGIVAQDGTTEDGDRLMRLTAFGWQVYRQHRLIIRRLTDAEVDRREREAGR
jgi:hypothetical protein